jgi:hypothetical protein
MLEVVLFVLTQPESSSRASVSLPLLSAGPMPEKAYWDLFAL